MAQILYHSDHWTLDEEICGGLNIVSQGRLSQPIMLLYAWNGESFSWQIVLCKACNLVSLAEFPEEIEKATSEQEAVDMINLDDDPAVCDFLSDVVTQKTLEPLAFSVIIAGKAKLVKEQESEVRTLLTGKVAGALLWWKL